MSEIKKRDNEFFYQLGKCKDLLNDPDGIFHVIADNAAAELFYTLFVSKELELQNIDNRKDLNTLRKVCSTDVVKKELSENERLRQNPKVKDVIEKIDLMLKDNIPFPRISEVTLEDVAVIHDEYKYLSWYETLNGDEKLVLEQLFNDFDRQKRVFESAFRKLEKQQYPTPGYTIFHKSVLDEILENYQKPGKNFCYLSSLSPGKEAFVNYESNDKELVDLSLNIQMHKNVINELAQQIDQWKDIFQGKKDLEQELLDSDIKRYTEKTQKYLSKKIQRMEIWVSDIFQNNRDYSENYIQGIKGIPIPIKIDWIKNNEENHIKLFFKKFFFDNQEKKYSLGYIVRQKGMKLESSYWKPHINIGNNFQNNDDIALVFFHISVAIVFHNFQEFYSLVKASLFWQRSLALPSTNLIEKELAAMFEDYHLTANMPKDIIDRTPPRVFRQKLEQARTEKKDLL